MPTVDEILGPAPKPTVDAILGAPPPGAFDWAHDAPEVAPAGATSKPPANTPQEHFINTTRQGRVLDAVGQGLKDGWGTQPIGLSPETEKFLSGVGILPQAQNGILAPLRAFNEALIRPAAAAWDIGTRALNSATYGFASLVGANVGEAEGKKGMDWDAARDTLLLAQTLGIVSGEGRPALPGPRVGTNFTGPKSALTIADEHAAWATRSETQGIMDVSTAKPGTLAADSAPPVKPTVMAAERTDPQTPHQLFSEPEATTVIDKAGNIRLDNADWSEGAKSVFRQVAEENGGPDAFLDARRGVQTLALREQAADAMGTDATWLLNAKKGQAFNDAEIEYATRIAVQSANDTAEAMRVAGRADATEADILRYAELKARHQSIQERFSAATAEGGRTLNALKKAKAAGEETQTFNEFIKGATGKSVDELRAEAKMGADMDTPQKLSRFLMESRKATTGDMLIEAWINGLLSGPMTHAKNIVSNLTTALWNVPETAVAATIGKVRSVFGSTDERVVFGEAGQELFGIVQGSREGLAVAAKAFKEETTSTVGKLDLVRQRAIPGQAGRVIRTPGRALTAEDEFFKAIGRRQATNRLAYRQASKEGLRGSDHATRVAQLVENPTDAMKMAADEQAAYQTFTSPLGPLGEALQNVQTANKAIRLVLTFVRTPVNIAKYTLRDRTPLGLLSQEIRDDMAGANGAVARDTAIARMAVGTAVGVTAINMAARGLITGSGPSDARERALLYATGWQPYSFKIGGMYYSYANIEPLATILGIPADLHDAATDKNNEGVTAAAGMFVVALAKNTASKTSLTGLMDLVQAVEDPDRYGKRYLDKLGGTLIPSVVAQYARAQDPYLRETADFVDTLKSRVPGLRENLLPRRDIWGEPIKLEGGLGPDLISPIYESRLKNDPVTQELIALGITPSQPDKQIKGADLTPEQYDEYQMAAGRLAKTTLDGLVAMEGWHDIPAFARKELIQRTMERSRGASATYMQMKHPELIQQAVENRIKAISGVEK